MKIILDLSCRGELLARIDINVKRDKKTTPVVDVDISGIVDRVIRVANERSAAKAPKLRAINTIPAGDQPPCTST